MMLLTPPAWPLYRVPPPLGSKIRLHQLIIIRFLTDLSSARLI
jgi:hypothetical protein